MRVSSLLLAALFTILAITSSACLFKPDLPGLEGRPCGPGDTCVSGYECKVGLCQPTTLGTSCDFIADDCSSGFCWFIAQGQDVCTIACASSSDCPAGFRCVEGDDADPGAKICLGGASLPGESVGSSTLGESCEGSGECQSKLCDLGLCTDTCQHQRQCEGTAVALDCRVIAVAGTAEARCARRLSGDGQGVACADSGSCSRGPCVDDGTGGGGGICTEPCCSSADCPSGTVCWIVSWSGWTPDDGQTRSCVPLGLGGGALIGENCGSDADCASGTCWEDPNTLIRACTDLCCTDADCPSSYRCEPQLYDLDAEPGEDSHVPLCVTRP